MKVRIRLELVNEENGADYLVSDYENEYSRRDGYASDASDLYVEVKSLFSAWVESAELAL